MRYGMIARLAVLATVSALILAGCGVAAPAPGAGDDDAATGAPNQVAWEVPPAGDLPEAVEEWVEEHKTQLGVFQQVFDDRTYILIAWGEKPTGGYAVEVADVALDGEALGLKIKLEAPESDAVVTQALTYPYALISVTPGRIYALRPEFDGAVFLENSSFRIELPALFSHVTDRVRVKGEARVFEGVFQINVEDGHNVLAQRTMQVEGAPAWAPFDVELELTEKPTSPNGVVYIYTHSAKDGSIIDQIVIPVVFDAWE